MPTRLPARLHGVLATCLAAAPSRRWLNLYDFRTVTAVIIITLPAGREATRMDMPLDWHYSSATPYRNGPKGMPAVKWHVEPCYGQFSEDDKQGFRRTRARNPHRCVYLLWTY